MKFQHQRTLLLGPTSCLESCHQQVIASKDNRNALFFSKYSPETQERFMICKCGDYTESTKYSKDYEEFLLSPNGDSLAMAKAISKFESGKGVSCTGYEIYINGRIAFHSDITNLWDITWLSNDELAWIGYCEDDRSQHKYVNGRDLGKTDDIYFKAVNLKSQNHYPERDQMPRQIKYADECVYLLYRNTCGPYFDQILGDFVIPRGSMGFNKDLSKVGYVGYKNGLMGKFCFKFADLQTAGHRRVINFFERYFGLVGGYIADFLDLLWRIFIKPFHPNLFSFRSSIPCDNHRPWKRAYYRVDKVMYTELGKLAVLAWPNKKRCVVSIDEEDGPLFDEIYNMVYDSEQKELSYIAIDGWEAFRVSVKC